MTPDSLKESIRLSTLTDEEQAALAVDEHTKKQDVEFVKLVESKNRENWLLGAQTKAFIKGLEDISKNINEDAICCSNRLNIDNQAFRLTLTEVKTINKILTYARTGTYTRD